MIDARGMTPEEAEMWVQVAYYIATAIGAIGVAWAIAWVLITYIKEEW